MSWKRLWIGVGITLAVVAPLVVASFVNIAIPHFREFFEREGWDAQGYPQLTNFALENEGAIVLGLVLVALVCAMVWGYIAKQHPVRLAFSTVLIVVCSLQVCLLALSLLVMTILLPLVSRSQLF